MQAYIVRAGFYDYGGVVETPEILSESEFKKLQEAFDSAVCSYYNLPVELRHRKKIDLADMVNYFIKNYGFKNAKFHDLG
jgi:hypothetical protein